MVLRVVPLQSLGHDNWKCTQYDFLVMWCHWHWHHMLPMALSMAHDIDASTDTSTDTKLQTPLNKHLSITNAMVSLMVPSALCYRKHVITMSVPKINMPVKCHIYQSVHMQIWDNYVTIYAPYEPNAISNMTMNTGIHTLNIIGICPSTNMDATLYLCFALQCYCSLHIDPRLLYI